MEELHNVFWEENRYILVTERISMYQIPSPLSAIVTIFPSAAPFLLVHRVKLDSFTSRFDTGRTTVASGPKPSQRSTMLSFAEAETVTEMDTPCSLKNQPHHTPCSGVTSGTAVYL